MTNPTSAGHDRYREWDAAYVLGALSAADRREYEEHLTSCPSCATAVAELAGMPGLLGTLPPADALLLLEESTQDARGPSLATAAATGTGGGPVPAEVLPRLMARVRRSRRIRRWTVGVVGVAAAAAIAAAVIVPMNLLPAPPPTVSTSLQQVVPSPISASIDLTSVKWGTTIAISCTYKAGGGWGPGTASDVRYAVYLTDRSGATERVSSWSAGPGTTVRTAGSTDMRESDIARVELRELDSNTVLLSRTL